jgi:hypothetical protein
LRAILSFFPLGRTSGTDQTEIKKPSQGKEWMLKALDCNNLALLAEKKIYVHYMTMRPQHQVEQPLQLDQHWEQQHSRVDRKFKTFQRSVEKFSSFH